MKQNWIGIAVGAALLALIAGLSLLWATQERPGMNLVANAEADLPPFELPDLDGVARNADEWQGKVLVVNYWATWCPPCREEMPHFVDAQEKFGADGLQVVGIAIDDPAMVKDFVDVYGINFTVLIGSVGAMEISRRMGNQFETLPYTAIYDRNGEMKLARAGMISAEDLHDALQPLL